MNTVKSRLQRGKQALRERILELDPNTGTVTVKDFDHWASSLRDRLGLVDRSDDG